MRSPFARPVTCRLPHLMLQPSLPRRSAAKAGPTQSKSVQPCIWGGGDSLSPLPPPAMRPHHSSSRSVRSAQYVRSVPFLFPAPHPFGERQSKLPPPRRPGDSDRQTVPINPQTPMNLRKSNLIQPNPGILLPHITSHCKTKSRVNRISYIVNRTLLAPPSTSR